MSSRTILQSAPIEEVRLQIDPQGNNPVDVTSSLIASQIVAKPNVSIGQAAVAGALANVMVSGIIQMNVGKINYWPGVDDAEFLDVLAQKHRVAVELASSKRGQSRAQE